MTGKAESQKKETFRHHFSLTTFLLLMCMGLKGSKAKELIRNVCSGRNITAIAVVSDFFFTQF